MKLRHKYDLNQKVVFADAQGEIRIAKILEIEVNINNYETTIKYVVDFPILMENEYGTYASNLRLKETEIYGRGEITLV